MLLPFRTSWPFRGIATLLFLLWCLPFAAPWMPGVVDCMMNQSIVASTNANSMTVQHSPSCHCVHCMGGMNGKRCCCCIKGHTPGERLAYSAVCDMENPITTASVVAKVTVFDGTISLQRPIMDAHNTVPVEATSHNLDSLFPSPLNQPPRLS